MSPVLPDSNAMSMIFRFRLAPKKYRLAWLLWESAPPVFLVAASDDQLGLASDSLRIYERWLAAGKPAELHLYARGGHGFGMRTQNLPADDWIERFGEWLNAAGFMEPD